MANVRASPSASDPECLWCAPTGVKGALEARIRLTSDTSGKASVASSSGSASEPGELVCSVASNHIASGPGSSEKDSKLWSINGLYLGVVLTELIRIYRSPELMAHVSEQKGRRNQMVPTVPGLQTALEDASDRLDEASQVEPHRVLAAQAVCAVLKGDVSGAQAAASIWAESQDLSHVQTAFRRAVWSLNCSRRRRHDEHCHRLWLSAWHKGSVRPQLSQARDMPFRRARNSRATSDFHVSKRLGSGCYGSVYRGELKITANNLDSLKHPRCLDIELPAATYVTTDLNVRLPTETFYVIRPLNHSATLHNDTETQQQNLHEMYKRGDRTIAPWNTGTTTNLNVNQMHQTYYTTHLRIGYTILDTVNVKNQKNLDYDRNGPNIKIHYETLVHTNLQMLDALDPVNKYFRNQPPRPPRQPPLCLRDHPL
eukprot:s983_g9.t1